MRRVWKLHKNLHVNCKLTFLCHVFDGLPRDVRHVAEDGEDDEAGDERGAAVDQAGDYRVPGDAVQKHVKIRITAEVEWSAA